jgi:histidinol phosphatase-like enzyme
MDNQQIIPEALRALIYYSENGWFIAAATNQLGVSEGLKTNTGLVMELRRTMALTGNLIRCVYACPDNGNSCIFLPPRPESVADPIASDVASKYPDLIGQFRKPGPGMLLAAMRMVKEEVDEVLFVGDSLEDQEAADNAKIPFMTPSEWYETVPSDYLS